MFQLSLKQSIKTHTCRVCGTQWDSTAAHAFYCETCRADVGRERRNQMHRESRARVRALNEKLMLSRDEKCLEWPRDSDDKEPSTPTIMFCDAYHNGRPMRSRSVVL